VKAFSLLVHTEQLLSTRLFLKKSRTSLNLNAQSRSENALETSAPSFSKILGTGAPMPKNKVNDPITDQEIAFARLVLSGAMTDRRAAEAVGLNPDSAAYTKSKPRVRAYMLEHRAAVQQQLVQQDVEGQRRLNLDREQVLARLWQIANLSPEMTRGSITGQVKALSMIVAMQGLIPDRRAVSAEKNSVPAPTEPDIYAAAWRRGPAGEHGGQHATTTDPQPSPASAQQEEEPARPACPGVPWSVPLAVPACPGVPWKHKLAPGSAADPPPDPGPSQSTFANRFTPSEAPEPYVPLFAPDMRVPFSIKKNPFVRPR
jgi:hypothetical protein